MVKRKRLFPLTQIKLPCSAPIIELVSSLGSSCLGQTSRLHVHLLGLVCMYWPTQKHHLPLPWGRARAPALGSCAGSHSFRNVGSCVLAAASVEISSRCEKISSLVWERELLRFFPGWRGGGWPATQCSFTCHCAGPLDEVSSSFSTYCVKKMSFQPQVLCLRIFFKISNW